MGLLDTQDNSQIMPSYTTTKGYGGEGFLSKASAEDSYFPDSGQRTDTVTGYTGTPREILNRYRAEGRDTTGLRERIGK